MYIACVAEYVASKSEQVIHRCIGDRYIRQVGSLVRKTKWRQYDQFLRISCISVPTFSGHDVHSNRWDPVTHDTSPYPRRTEF